MKYIKQFFNYMQNELKRKSNKSENIFFSLNNLANFIRRWKIILKEKSGKIYKNI